MLANQGLHRWHQSTGHQEKITIQNPHEIQQSIETRDNLARFDTGDVHLRQTNPLAELSLTPAALAARSDELGANGIGYAL
jgi:hypothetical protein